MSIVVRATLLTALAAFGQTAQEQPMVDIAIDKVGLALPGKDRIRFTVMPRIETRRDVAVRQVAFSQMRIGRIPVYVPPVTERLELKEGVPASPSRPLEVTVYLRDLESTGELQRIVRDGEAVVSGVVTVEVAVNPLVKLALFTRQVRSQVRFEKKTPVDIPGGVLGRASALALLRSADKAVDLLQAGKNRIAPNEEKTRALAAVESSVVIALTRYELRDKQGAATVIEIARGGLRLGGGRILLPRESAEPWLYDFEAMVAIDSGEVKLAKESVDVTVFALDAWLAAPDGKPDEARGWSLRRKQLRLLKTGKAEETAMFGKARGKRVKVSVRKRASSGNVSLWELDGPGTANAPKLDLAPDARQWDRLALFRAQGPELEAILLACRLDGARIAFPDPIDSGAWGLPIVHGAAIAGVVQDEHSGLLIRDALRSLGIVDVR